MRAMALSLAVLVSATSFFAVPAAEAAGITAAHRKKLSSIRRDLSEVSRLLRRDEVEEAEKIIEQSIEDVKAILEEAEVKPSNPAIAGIARLIVQRRNQLLKLKSKGDPVSFEKEIAPILKANCTRCHGGNRASGGLNMETFTGLMAGGNSRSRVVSPGASTRSLLMARLNAGDAQKRMPKGKPALSREQREKIAIWINQGAKFDGKDKGAPIGESAEEPVQIARATGNESVSFTEDLAPFFNNLCLRCHNGNRGRSGFSVASYEDIMRGGDSGRVILPGNLEDSRLWRLVGGLENPRMPNDPMARITRKHYADLRTWILEGAKFDGEDPKTPLRQLVPSEEEKKEMEFAKLTPEEFAEYRKERADELWDTALKKSPPRWAIGDDFIVYGNVSETRLVEINEWATEHAKNLRRAFGVRGNDPLWKGKLTIFVTAERFDFDEFVLVNLKRRAPRDLTGVSQVTSSGEDAYVLVQDVGESLTGEKPGTKMTVIEHVTAAFLKRGGGSLPDWLVRGTGLAIASANEQDDPYVTTAMARVPKAVASLRKAEDVFANGTFSPSMVGPVGASIVSYMIENGGTNRFGRFVQSMQSGKDVGAAMKEVYRADLKTVARAYVADLLK